MKRTLIIAEAGVNHNGSTELALQLIDAAAAAGADAVKFQTFQASKLVTRTSSKAEYQERATGTGESQFDMLRALELSRDAFVELQRRCTERNIEFMSSPFDEDSLDLLTRDLRVVRVKLGSGELTNGPLLLRAARAGRPIILSTGMGTLEDIESALHIIAFGLTFSDGIPPCEGLGEIFSLPTTQSLLREKVTLLHCSTEYPTPFAEANLRAMNTMRDAFGLNVGYSDHCEGIAVSVAAAALGAVVIEKHFTLSRSLPGPDHQASLEPPDFATMVRAIREVEAGLGDGAKVIQPSEAKNIKVARKSLVAARAISAGEVFDETNIAVKRPGGFLSPMKYWSVLGRLAPRDFKSDEPIET
jgi:N-acetylneuraminate synthase